MVPVFYAINNTRYPVAGSFLAVATNIIIILLSISSLQHAAMALSISGAMTANFLFLGTVLYWKLEGFSLKYLMSGLGKVIFAALGMGFYLYGIRVLLAGWMQKGFLAELGGVFALILSGAAVYGLVLYLLKLHELRMIVDKILNRIRGGRSEE